MSKGWRTSPLPSGWDRIRTSVLTRDGYTCQLAYTGCLTQASEVDHIGHNSDHTLPNLRAVCTPCHATRTAGQANEARKAKYGKRLRIETHPAHRGG